jgi:hypothetical protein
MDFDGFAAFMDVFSFGAIFFFLGLFSGLFLAIPEKRRLKRRCDGAAKDPSRAR